MRPYVFNPHPESKVNIGSPLSRSHYFGVIHFEYHQLLPFLTRVISSESSAVTAEDWFCSWYYSEDEESVIMHLNIRNKLRHLTGTPKWVILQNTLENESDAGDDEIWETDDEDSSNTNKGKVSTKKKSLVKRAKTMPSAIMEKLTKLTKLVTKDRPEEIDSSIPTDKHPLLNVPMEILFKITDHLDPIDRTIFRYTCTTLYKSIPAVKPVQAGADNDNIMTQSRDCANARTRLITRLLDSPALLPTIRSADGKHRIHKSEIKSIFRRCNGCPMCETYRTRVPSASGNRSIQCPFHFRLARSSAPIAHHVRGLFHPRALIRSMTKKRPKSHGEYHAMISSIASRAPISSFKSFYYDFVRSWIVQVLHFEDERGPDGPLTEVWTLFCCNHCMNVLPGNEYGSDCEYCDCRACGWSEVDILRVEGTEDARPRFIPLGKLVDNGEDGKGKKSKDKGKGKEVEKDDAPNEKGVKASAKRIRNDDGPSTVEKEVGKVVQRADGASDDLGDDTDRESREPEREIKMRESMERTAKNPVGAGRPGTPSSLV